MNNDKLPLRIIDAMLQKRAGKGKAIGAALKAVRPGFWKALGGTASGAAGAAFTPYEYKGKNPFMGSMDAIEPHNYLEEPTARALNFMTWAGIPGIARSKTIGPLAKRFAYGTTLATTPLVHHGIGLSAAAGRGQEQGARLSETLDKLMDASEGWEKGMTSSGEAMEGLGTTLSDAEKELKTAPGDIKTFLKGLSDIGGGASTVTKDITAATGQFDDVLKSVADVKGEVSKVTGSADKLTGQMERGISAIKSLRDAAKSPGATAIYGGIAGLLASKLFSDDPKLYTGKEKQKVAKRNKIRRLIMTLTGAGVGYAANSPSVISSLSKLLQRPSGGGGGADAGAQE